MIESKSKKQLLVQGHEVTVGYEGAPPILEQVSFDIYAHDFVGVIGPNGGGKTTLMKAILGLLTPTHGTIRYYDTEGYLTTSPTIGYVPQQNALDRAFPISVREAVGHGLLTHNHMRLSRNEEQQVEQALEQVGMGPFMRHAIGTLSGGQLQRVLLARALVSRPSLLILDEPNTYVDKHFESQLYSLLPEINRESAVVIVSHDIGSVSRMSRRLFCVNRMLHVHETDELSDSCEECAESAALRYLSLLQHHS